MSSIIIIGSLNADLISSTRRLPAPGETLAMKSFSTAPGGKGANQAVACGRLSSPRTSVSMIGRVGTDPYASLLRTEVSAAHVDISKITTVPGPTGTAIIIVEEGGDNRILINPGANGSFSQGDFPDDFFKGQEGAVLVMQLEIPFPVVLKLLRLAKQSGVRTVFNPAPASHLPVDHYPYMEWFIVNETEAAMLTGVESEELESEEGARKAVNTFLERGAENVVVTLGGRGCVWGSKAGESGKCGVKGTGEVIDTTGAGDTFVGALAVAIVEGKTKEGSIEWASKASGVAVRKKGAMAGVPWRKEVDSSE